MNREEAIKIFSGIASLAKINTEPTMSVCNVKNEVFTEILQALLGPQPDPITGLVPCGGRKAMLCCTVGEGFWVACSGVSQANRYETEAFAIKAWNESMGYTSPPRPGAIGPETGEMDPNWDEGVTE